MNSPLENWQKENGVSNKALSDKINVHQSLITHIHKGRRTPSASLAMRIQEATGGAVTVMELLFPDKTGDKGA